MALTKATRSSWSPARPAASSRRSPPTWRKASGGTFHLLDLTPSPARDDADIAAFRSDKDGLKATLVARLKAPARSPTPVVIDKELARIERLSRR
jgi:hypothetical protein